MNASVGHRSTPGCGTLAHGKARPPRQGCAAWPDRTVLPCAAARLCCRALQKSRCGRKRSRLAAKQTKVVGPSCSGAPQLPAGRRWARAGADQQGRAQLSRWRRLLQLCTQSAAELRARPGWHAPPRALPSMHPAWVDGPLPFGLVLESNGSKLCTAQRHTAWVWHPVRE